MTLQRATHRSCRTPSSTRQSTCLWWRLASRRLTRCRQRREISSCGSLRSTPSGPCLWCRRCYPGCSQEARCGSAAGLGCMSGRHAQRYGAACETASLGGLDLLNTVQVVLIASKMGSIAAVGLTGGEMVSVGAASLMPAFLTWQVRMLVCTRG